MDPLPKNRRISGTLTICRPLRPVLAAYRSAATLAMAIAACLHPAQAQTDFTKADNTTSLNQAASYTANSGVPGATDRIIVTNNFTTSRTANLGGNLLVSNITYAGNWQFQINNTASTELTIGSGGINKTTSSNFIIAAALKLGANQTWNIDSGNMQVNNAVKNDSAYTLQINGSGTLDLRPTTEVTYGSTVTIDTTVSVNSATAIVNLGGLNTFNSLSIPNGRVRGNTIGDFGTASSVGDGGTSTAITLGGNASSGIFEYTGASTNVNRTFNRDARSASSGIEVSNAATTLTLTGNLGSTSTSASDTGWVFGGAGNLVLNGSINNLSGGGNTALNKKDTGTLVLGNNNTYAGITDISNGVVRVSHANGLGSTAAGTKVRSGAALELSNNINTAAEAITLYGDGVSSAGSLRNVSGANTNNGAITLASASRVNADTGTTLTVAGGLDNAGFGLTVGGAGLSVFSSAITGSGGLTKDGAGTATLSSDANGYTGGTLISTGTLQIGNGGATGALSTSSTITNNGVLAFNRTGTIVQGTGFSGSAITGSGALVKDGAGTLVLNAANEYAGGTTLNAGAIFLAGNNVLGSGTLTINGGRISSTNTSRTLTNAVAVGANFTLGGGGVTTTLNGGMDLGGAARTIALNNSATIGGAISNGGLAITGVGYSLILTGTSTYTGGTTINSGTLQVGNGGTTGSIASTSGVTNNGTLAYNRNDNISSSYAISGSGNVTKSGAGTLALSGANSYSGGTLVSVGTLRGDSTSLQGNITNNAAVIFANATSGTYAGAMSGSGTLAKNGAGTLTLTATNTYNGATAVESGKLVVNGAISNSAVTVTNTGILGGSGTVGNLIIADGGTLAPGNSPGTLFAASATWTNGGSYDWEILDATATAGATNGWDLLDVAGTLSLTGLSNSNFTINLITLSDSTTPGPMPMANFNSSTNYSWMIARAGTISGFNASMFNLYAGAFSSAYSGSFGITNGLHETDQALFLTYTPGGAPIPEPGTWAVGLLLATATALAARRKLRAQQKSRLA